MGKPAVHTGVTLWSDIRRFRSLGLVDKAPKQAPKWALRTTCQDRTPQDATRHCRTSPGANRKPGVPKHALAFGALEVGVWCTTRYIMPLRVTWQDRAPQDATRHRRAPLGACGKPAASRHALVRYLHQDGRQGVIASPHEPPGKAGRHETSQGTVAPPGAIGKPGEPHSIQYSAL
jgi:hypothetical protein